MIPRSILIYAGHRDGDLESDIPGLIAEARDIISQWGGTGTVTALVVGSVPETALELLGTYGADRVLYVKSESIDYFHCELLAEILFRMAKRDDPSCILMAQGPVTADLSARLAALMETALVTRAMDFRISKEGMGIAVRPVANGYLFEELSLKTKKAPIICLLPSVLGTPDKDWKREAEIVVEHLDPGSYELMTRVAEVIEAAPEGLDLEEADIIVSGGRGAGRGESFDVMHELAAVIGGSVGGTRPVIDWQTLPFDRQIGQTGKTVTPRLLFACGISGANEFTAGMEKSGLVVAINKDPNARIFRFADLGVIGDLNEVIPRLIEEIKKMGEEEF